MESHECPLHDEIIRTIDAVSRWTSVMEGNGREALGTRLNMIENNQKRDCNVMESLLDSTEKLKSNVHAMIQQYDFESKNKKNTWLKFKDIALILIALGSVIIAIIK